MEFIEDIAALEALYGQVGVPARRKVAPYLIDTYRAWIERSRFCVLSTVGPEGTDGTPRGDESPVVQVLDDYTLAMPDWRGNNRIDSLRNIVRDGRVSLMFLVPGSTNAMRVNGKAKLTTDEGMRARFEKDGRQPATVIVIAIEEVYPQCARALLRSELWTLGDQSAGLPTVGDMLTEITKGTENGKAYDEAWPARARQTMW
ncbi:pyridoxamine 5'-phosphate oxidase family protein [Chachezhania sediminis]|uniref:pyridoxamine 5'-phosphate oxidase family protein n=1 Tax=Chachezhania sediminis TaxID=2599291 RepID=UPI00131B38A1|nr:pyridoxamine 5'-phosphate oxidase family protein [Chachezhania sediminis]